MSISKLCSDLSADSETQSVIAKLQSDELSKNIILYLSNSVHICDDIEVEVSRGTDVDLAYFAK